jgi:hypothetical protein
LSKNGEAPKEESAQSFTNPADLLAAYTIPSDLFTITLESGHNLQFRPPRDAQDMLAATKHSQTLDKLWRQGMSVPDDCKEWLPITPEAMKMCVFISEYSVNPKFSMADCLRMSKTCGTLILTIFNELTNKSDASVAQATVEAIDETKNDYSEIVSSGCFSLSRATFTASIRTN